MYLKYIPSQNLSSYTMITVQLYGRENSGVYISQIGKEIFGKTEIDRGKKPSR